MHVHVVSYETNVNVKLVLLSPSLSPVPRPLSLKRALLVYFANTFSGSALLSMKSNYSIITQPTEYVGRWIGHTVHEISMLLLFEQAVRERTSVQLVSSIISLTPFTLLHHCGRFVAISDFQPLLMCCWLVLHEGKKRSVMLYLFILKQRSCLKVERSCTVRLLRSKSFSLILQWKVLLMLWTGIRHQFPNFSLLQQDRAGISKCGCWVEIIETGYLGCWSWISHSFSEIKIC